MATVSLKSREGKWIMASTILASAMAFIDGTALNVVLPALQESLAASGSDLFWILNAYLLMLASLILIGGTLGDNLGRKKVFMIGIVVFIAGSAACGFASNVTWLVIFRLLQGIGGALMIPGSLSVISSSIHEQERGKAIGTWSSFTTFVTLGGPILGGALADMGLWRYIFFINIPIGFVALLMLLTRVKVTEELPSDKPLDYKGALTIAIALALLTLGFLRIPAVGFNSFQTYFSLGLGLIFLCVFIYVEYKSAYPMMPLTLFSSTIFSGANLLTFFLYAGLGGGMLFLSLNLVQVQGYSQLQSGLTFLPFTILMISLARFAGKLSDQYGPRIFLIAGPATAGAGLLLLSFVGQTAGPKDYWGSFFPGILIFGLGMSFTVAPLTTAVMGSVSEHFSGTASGVNNAMTRISNVFANAIFGALAVVFFTGYLSSELEKHQFSCSEKAVIVNQAANLGNAKVPVSLDKEKKTEAGAAYRNAFIYSYSNIMRISSALAFLSAWTAAFFIKKQHKNKSGEQQGN